MYGSLSTGFVSSAVPVCPDLSDTQSSVIATYAYLQPLIRLCVIKGYYLTDLSLFVMFSWFIVVIAYYISNMINMICIHEQSQTALMHTGT